MEVFFVKYLIMDLSRLGLICSLVEGNRAISAEFDVIAEYRTDLPMLSIISCHLPVEHDGRARSINPGLVKQKFDLRQFVNLLQKNQALLEWDHSPIGTHLEYRYGRRIGALDMGADGHYRFATLTKMAKYCPDLITDMLTPVVSRL